MGTCMRCIRQALNPLSIHVTFTAIVPGAYLGEAKMCLRLSWGSEIPPPAKRVKAGWLQKLTHVPLVIAHLLGACPLIHPNYFSSSYSFLSLNYKYRINFCILALGSGQRLLYRLGLVLVLRCNAIAQFGWVNGQGTLCSILSGSRIADGETLSDEKKVFVLMLTSLA